MDSSHNALSEFLKSRRARIRPEDVGLPYRRKRRIHGLRREEVAALAGVGSTWYGLLEAGQPIHVSRRVLDSIGSVLHLSTEELRYLHVLVDEPVADDTDFELAAVVGTMQAALNHITTAPAFVFGPRLDCLALNRVAALLYRLPDGQTMKNLLLHIFTEPSARQIYADWDANAARLTSKLRGHYGRHRRNPSFERLIGQLTTESREFCALWERHEVTAPRMPLMNAFRTSRGDLFQYHLQPFDMPNCREQRLVIMLPAERHDEEIVCTLLDDGATS